MTFFVFDGPSATLPSLSGPESSNCFRDGRAPVKNHRLNVEKLGFCFSLGEKLRLVMGKALFHGSSMKGMFGEVTTAGTELRNSFDIGGRDWFPAYIINAGVEWNSRHRAIQPEVRYSHWEGRQFRSPRHPHQLEFFIGFSLRHLFE